MTTMYLMVGEERSPLAKRKGWRWEDGRLAAKQLFDALRECHIPPGQILFTNLFEPGGRARIKDAYHKGWVIVAMGRKVQAELARMDIPHRELVHPAARGSIRKKERYISHVQEVLCGTRTR